MFRNPFPLRRQSPSKEEIRKFELVTIFVGQQSADYSSGRSFVSSPMSGIKIPAGALPPERVHFSLPLSKEKRENVELSVAKALATGRAVGGGIFLTSKDSKFAYIRSEGDTEVPLDVQVPLLKSHDRDLGLQRNQTHSIYFVKANAATFARLFVRVLHGKAFCRAETRAEQQVV